MALDRDNPLAAEILRETAESYFGACRKMVDSLEALKSFDAAGASSGDHRPDTRRTQLLDDAAERVYFVIVQREAMNLSWYEEFFEDYGVPKEVKTRLGKKWRR